MRALASPALPVLTPGVEGTVNKLVCIPNSCVGTPSTAICNLGSWSTPGPDISEVKLTCSPNPCSGTPSTASMPADAAFQCSSLASGAKCSASCNAKFTAAASTSWVSTCSAGSWGTPAPGTGNSKLDCLASCNGKPSPDPALGVFSCSTDLADAMVQAMLVDLQALLVEIDSKGILSVAQSSCTTDVPLSKLQVEITLTEAVAAKRKRTTGTGTWDKLRSLVLGSGLAPAMPTIVKVLQQAGVGYAESETKASLSSAVVKDGSTVQGSLCAAGQQAYEPSGPCYVCPPWQYNPVAAGSCSQIMCGLNKAAGDCDAATGRCNCPIGSRLEPVFAANPSVPARNVTPEVPACIYDFTPTGTFKLSGMKAKIGQFVNVTFKLAKPSNLRAAAAACITLDAAAPLVGIGNYPNCPLSSVSAASVVNTSATALPQLINLMRPACIGGQYSVMVKVPNNFKSKKCFNVGVQLADGTTKRSIIAITALN
ncbi:hypothetical protein OEZ85_007385 [Tetradesmus obliquus]|uniref:Uncharacterized protein n=1 Tax=Tetradesmus obliquus TaxID=3088 RepID=A0ABY8TJA2_TETOB|nr:hypothetical protein OEZ85_007385 [Tetradesmus obliquus]